VELIHFPPSSFILLCGAMNGEPLRRTFTVQNPQGLHMRPITAFVEVANKFKSDVFLAKEGDSKINGKSPLGLLGLAAEQGTQLTLEVNGPDAAEALAALLDVLAKSSSEE
jgi:phosphotransferase system HPr (HPr) family protein